MLFPFRSRSSPVQHLYQPIYRNANPPHRAIHGHLMTIGVLSTKSIGGCLIRTAPAASSCYDGNPLNSPYNCTEVKERWNLSVFHASWPESISYSVFTNNSCIPPGKAGYTKEKGCSIGGLPLYIVNATKEEQIATAMEWASKRNIRIVIKSTGHDFNGRYVFIHA